MSTYKRGHVNSWQKEKEKFEEFAFNGYYLGAKTCQKFSQEFSRRRSPPNDSQMLSSFKLEDMKRTSGRGKNTFRVSVEAFEPD